MVFWGKIVDWIELITRVGTKISVLKIAQSALHDTGMVQWRLQLDDGGVQPLSTLSVHQLPVDHGCLSVGVSVEVDHGHALLVGSDHPGLHHLARHQLLQHEGGDVLIVSGVDVGKITFYGLERQGEEVSSDLSETVDTDTVVTSVVQVLDITHLCVLVIGDNLTSVPTFITWSCTDGVEEDRLGDVGTVGLAVGVGHALVQSFQGKVGWVIWLLQKYVASTHYGGHEHVVHNSLRQSKVDTAVVEINLIISTSPIHLLKTYLRITSEFLF